MTATSTIDTPTDRGLLTPPIFLGVVAFVSLAGLWLRAKDPGVMLFNIDEAAISIYAAQIANLRQFHLTGVLTSQGFHNPPLFLYLLAPFYVVSLDPRFASFGMALAGTAAVFLAALTGRRLSTPTAGIVAAVIVAFSPTAIEHSRRLWGHDTMICFAALVAYCTVRGIQEKRTKWLAAAAVACTAAQACHLSGVLLWLIPGGALLLFRPPGVRQVAIAAVVALGLVYLPWLAHDAGLLAGPQEENRVRFEQTRMIANVALGRADIPRMESPMPAWHSWVFMLGDQRHGDLLGPEHQAFLAEGLPLPLRLFRDAVLAALAVGLGAFALGSLITAIRRRSLESEGQRWALVLGTAALAPLVLFTVLPVTTVPAYQLPALVPLVLLAAIASGGLVRFRLPARLVMIGLFCIAMAVYGIASTNELRAQARDAGPDSRVSPTFEAKLDAMIHITQSGELDTYSIMQDNRSISAGVDFWVLYTHFWLSRDPAAPIEPDTPRLFVIRDNLVEVPEGVDLWLAEKPVEHFGTLRVHRLEGAAAAEWRLAMRGSAPPEEG